MRSASYSALIGTHIHQYMYNTNYKWFVFL